MSVDLTRPLVRSSGQHDALDGWLAVAEIVARAPAASAGEPPLARELVLARELCVEGDWATEDPLGAGALLVVLMPGSNIVCALVGYRRMRTAAFAACLSIGIVFRLAWVWIAAKIFEDQLTTILDWIERYQWWLVGAFMAITFLQSWRKASTRPVEAEDLLDGTEDTTAVLDDDLERDLENGPG